MNTATFTRKSVRSRRLNWDHLMATARENFARNLARLLRDQNLKGRQLAEKLALSDSTISGWLNGRISPELGRLDAIAAALGVNYYELLLDDEQPAHPSTREIKAIRELALSKGFELVPRGTKKN